MRSNFTFDLVVLILWLAVIFAVSSVPGDVLSNIQNKPKSFFLRKLISDPVMHFAEYAVLAFLSARLCSNFSIGVFGLFYVVGGAGFIALCDELYQWRAAGRAFEVKDLFMDVLGIITTILILLPVKRILALG